MTEATAPDLEFMGARACVNCHASESLAWMQTAHHRSYELLNKPAAHDYARALGLTPRQMLTDSACLNCHATAGDADERGHRRIFGGVSCESCHGRAGGPDGWLNLHAVYGPAGTTFAGESLDHRQWRMDRVANAGMIRADRIDAVANACLNCHLVNDESLVNAGHWIGSDFELVGWLTGVVRHNFHVDQSVNQPHPSLWQQRYRQQLLAANSAQETAALDITATAANAEPDLKDEAARRKGRRRLQFLIGLLNDLDRTLAALTSVRQDSDYSIALRERASHRIATLKRCVKMLAAPAATSDPVGASPDVRSGLIESHRLASAAVLHQPAAHPTAATNESIRLFHQHVRQTITDLEEQDGTQFEILDPLLHGELIETIGRPVQP